MFGAKTGPWAAPGTALGWECFGDRLGDRLGVVWRPQSNAIQQKYATSNQMQPTSNAIQTISTQSNAIQQKYATSNPMQSTSNAIQSIFTQSKQSNHSKQRKCEMQRNPHNAIQSNFLPSGN